MDRRFLTLTASLSALTFGGVWMLATPPGESAPADIRALIAGTAPSGDADAPDTAPRIFYPGCDAVRAAGKAPLFRDQPGYRPEMDGDDDGIACEPHPTDAIGGGGHRRGGRR